MIRHYNYVLLLGGLLFMLVGGSLGAEYPRVNTRLVVNITLLGVIILGVWSLVNWKPAFIAGWILGALTLALVIGAHVTGHLVLQYLALTAVLIFLFLSCIIAAYDVLLGGSIDINRLVGAVCIYLLSGALWGIVHFLVSIILPGSFEGIVGESLSKQLNEFIYYSFVTLTTLGYGDITPQLPIARSLSYLEAVLGQLYLTILVAALVGIHIANRRQGESDNAAAERT